MDVTDLLTSPKGAAEIVPPTTPRVGATAAASARTGHASLAHNRGTIANTSAILRRECGESATARLTDLDWS